MVAGVVGTGFGAADDFPTARDGVLMYQTRVLSSSAAYVGGVWFFAADGMGNGLEFEIMLAVAAIAVILTGPGLYSFDRRWGWSRRPAWGSAAWLVIGIGVAVAVWMVFNGANPLVTN